MDFVISGKKYSNQANEALEKKTIFFMKNNGSRY